MTKQAVGSGQSLMQKTQSAGRLAAISAEKAKVLNVDVARLYATLGKSIHDERSNRSAFPEHFKILDALSEQIVEASKKSSPETEGTSFSDRAKALGAKGVQYAVSQKLAMQRASQYLQLGKTAYEMPGKPAAASPVSKQIDQLLERVAAIEEEAAGLGKAAGASWLSPKKMLGGALAIVALLCVLFLGRMTGSSSKPVAKARVERNQQEEQGETRRRPQSSVPPIASDDTETFGSDNDEVVMWRDKKERRSQPADTAGRAQSPADDPDPVIQAMKIAGTYTPEAAKSIREFRDALKNKTGDPETAIRAMKRAGIYTPEAARNIQDLRDALERQER